MSFTVKLGDLQSAAESFERSLDIAKKLNDGPAESAIKKAMEEVNSRIVQGVKEGDDKDDDDDKGSVKSDKDRKGATSQQASGDYKAASLCRLWFIVRNLPISCPGIFMKYKWV